MAEDQQKQGSGKPTQKMMEFAKAIATKIGVRVPEEVMASFEECSAFIEKNKDAALRPSDKQLKYAQTISQSKSVPIPDSAMNNGKELSAWIDAHK